MKRRIFKNDLHLFLILMVLVYLVEYIEWAFPPGNVWDYNLDLIWNVSLLIYGMGGFAIAASIHIGARLYNSKVFLGFVIFFVIADGYILDLLLNHDKHYLSVIILGSHVYLLCCSLLITLVKNRRKG